MCDLFLSFPSWRRIVVLQKLYHFNQIRSCLNNSFLFDSPFLIREQPSAISAFLNDPVSILDQPFAVNEMNNALLSRERRVRESDLALIGAANQQRRISGCRKDTTMLGYWWCKWELQLLVLLGTGNEPYSQNVVMSASGDTTVYLSVFAVCDADHHGVLAKDDNWPVLQFRVLLCQHIYESTGTASYIPYEVALLI